MKNLFKRGGRAGAPRKVDPFMERDTYWDEDEKEYDWDSAEEESYYIEETEEGSEGNGFLEEDADTSYEPVDDEESYSEAVAAGSGRGKDTSSRDREDVITAPEDEEELDIELDSYEFGEDIEEEGEEPYEEIFSDEDRENPDAVSALTKDSAVQDQDAAAAGTEAGYSTEEALPDTNAEYCVAEETDAAEGYYAPNGDLDAECYETDETAGEAEYYEPDETVGEAEHYEPDGTAGEAEYYEPDGTIVEAEYYEPDGTTAEAEYYEPDGTIGEAEYYGPDGTAGEAEYYEPDGTIGEAEYYGPDGTAGEAEYYEPDGTAGETGYYRPDEVDADAEYYGTEEAAAAETGYYETAGAAEQADSKAYSETEGYQDSEEESGDFWEESTVKPAGNYKGTGKRTAVRHEKSAAGRKKQTESRSPEGGFFARLGGAVRSMDVMDRVMVITGVAVLVLAIVTGGVFIRINTNKRQVDSFADVGRELEGIAMIGENGLMAVASVQMTRFGASTPVPEEDSQGGYNENSYERDVSVEPNFTSIQKDLKIKFINKKSDKLVANVPFSVTVTDPDGKEQIWSDDDMDGIIHKKDITPGMYQVAMEPLTDEKYAGYILFTDSQTVEVKKEIAYEKVNVANEVKKESEVNAAKEDTRKNETVVESTLKDTVAWVESKVISATYNEVAKNTIPDPATLAVAMAQRALYLSAEEEMPATETGEGSGEDSSSSQEESSAEPPSSGPSEEEPTDAPTEEPQPTEEPTEAPTANPTTPPTQAPTAEPTQAPTANPTTPPTQAPTAEPTQAPTANPTTPPTQAPTAEPTQAPTTVPTAQPTQDPGPVLAKGTVSVTPAELAAVPGNVLVAKATAEGFTSGQKIVYAIVSSNTAVATATVDGAGNINVTAVADGTALLTVAANYENGGAETQATASIRINVQGSNVLTLDKTTLNVYAEVPAVINAKFSNTAAAAPALTAETSDTGIATVSVDKTAITITGVKEGVAIITVKGRYGNQDLSAVCTVTVRRHPREDNATLLKDADGQQVYVMEGNDYREATRADYYTADKFFIKGDAKYSGWQTLEGKVYYFKADGSKVTGEQVIQGAKYNFASDGSLVTGSNGTVGIDVSKWNGKIDWNAVKNSGISYVIIRCGYRGSAQGSLIEDPKFETNIKGATAAGLKVGVYFFTQAVDEMEAVEEASMVLDQIRNYKISYPVFLDVEASGGRADKIDKATRTAVCKAFCQTIQNGGYTAGIYANKTWLESKIDAGSLSAYKIWLAQYASKPSYKGRYDLWQYRSTGSVSGISGNVDFNISYLGY